MNRQQAKTTTQNPASQQSDSGCYKYSGPLVNGSRVNQCDERKEDEIHRRQSLTHHDQQQQSQMPARSGSCYKYSGPIVQSSYVDQCEQSSHLPHNEQTDKWQPLGLDHQSGYSYLYQHSGFECAEKDEEKQAAARAREQRS